MKNEKAIEILKALWRSKDPEEYEETEIRAAISEAIGALQEAGRYEMVTVRKEGDNRLETVLKDNGTQCYYCRYITIEAARRVFGIIELKDRKKGGDPK